MIKHLTKHGNSLALVIDKPILELLNIDEKTPLEITTDGHSLCLGPARTEDQFINEKFKRALQDTNQKYGPMLKRLAE